jgi:hypothetical protein
MEAPPPNENFWRFDPGSLDVRYVLRGRSEYQGNPALIGHPYLSRVGAVDQPLLCPAREKTCPSKVAP